MKWKKKCVEMAVFTVICPEQFQVVLTDVKLATGVKRKKKCANWWMKNHFKTISFYLVSSWFPTLPDAYRAQFWLLCCNFHSHCLPPSEELVSCLFKNYSRGLTYFE